MIALSKSPSSVSDGDVKNFKNIYLRTV